MVLVYGLDPKTVGNNVTSHGTRLIDLSSYVVNGTRKYAASSWETTTRHSRR